jgi:hypothetical protein
MSSFQLYEFQALDRVLSNADQTYLNSLSSRAELTATSARYTYSYSDFRTQPLQVLDRCFDIMLYQASYGTRQLAIRLPRALANVSHYEPYCVPDLIELHSTPKSIILDISISCENYGGWLSEESCLPELVEIRSALLQGDLRVLYLAWLASAYAEDCSFDWETTLEPPVPPNLKKLSPALTSFAEIFEIDLDLIAAAATQSTAISAPSAEPIETWIAALPEIERNQYLLRVAQGENHVGLELMQRLRQQFGKSPAAPTGTAASRTFAQLETASAQKLDERKQKAKAAAETAEQQRLKSLMSETDKLWELVQHLIKRGQAQTYDEAIAHLKDLQAIATLQNDSATFQKRVQQIEQDFSRKRSLISRLKQANLI